MKLIVYMCLLHSAIKQSDATNFVDGIRKLFNFDFATGMNVGDVLAWRISKEQEQFKPISHEEVESLFHPKGTTLILTHRTFRTWQFYYWAGNEALLEDKYELVKCTMVFYLSAREYYDKTFVIYISREQQGVETFSFEEAKSGLIHNRKVTAHEKYSFYQKYHDFHLPSTLPNLYAIRGTEFTHIKKVSLHEDWLNVADACLILEVGISKKEMVPINILCGPNSSEKSQMRTERFVQNFYYYWREYLRTYVYIHFIEPDDSAKLKQFEDIVKAGNLHNPYEVDDPKDRYECADEFLNTRNEASLFHFDKDFIKHNIPQRPIHSGLFHDKHGAYLLDTKNAAGIFLIIGEYATVHLKAMVIEEVEKYLHKDTVKQIPIRVRIVEINAYEAEAPIDFHIQLADWPPKLALPSYKFW